MARDAAELTAGELLMIRLAPIRGAGRRRCTIGEKHSVLHVVGLLVGFALQLAVTSTSVETQMRGT